MKDISDLKKFFFGIVSQKFCSLGEGRTCDKKRCECLLIAEIQALVAEIVPVGFRDYTIHDFTGMSKSGEVLLDSKSVIEAKRKIISYCWDGMTLEQVRDLSLGQLTVNSTIGDSIRNGVNVVIHGEPGKVLEVDKNTGNSLMSEKQTGRTLVASLLTKEAIRLRARTGYYDLSYGWLGYSSLIQSLSKGDAHENQFCDWLVIDDIPYSVFSKTSGQRAFEQSLLDPFLVSRKDSGLPTIFVFRFDVTKDVQGIESAFGVAMHKILNDDKTVTIRLKGSVINNG